MSRRIFIRMTKDIIPQVRNKYPFIYLEHGRVEIDDSSIKWIDCDRNIVRIPCALISTLLLGPGTTITHEAIKVLSSVNCLINWVGDDSFFFYAVGKNPVNSSRNIKKQIFFASDSIISLKIARKMFAKRFFNMDISQKNLHEIMGLEGIRVRNQYRFYSKKYNVVWRGRSYVPGNFNCSDITNKIITYLNSSLYSLLLSIVYSMGYSPYIGFIHSGSPLPFVYDLADLYKEYYVIDLAFFLSVELSGKFSKKKILDEFRKRIIENKLMEKIPEDINNLFKNL